MSKGTAIIGMLVALVLGVFIGQSWNKGESSATVAQVPAAALPDTNVERYKIPVGNAPVRGPDAAKVTIVEWSDYQCPFCSRVEPTLEQITKAYGKDVRIAWKNQPLPFHQNAMPSAEVATAAYAKKGNQAFWKTHDTLFHNQQALDRASLEKYGKDVGLSDDELKEALDGKKYDQQIQADAAEGAKFGARGTPAFFINGRPLSGAQPFEAFKKVIDEELANATKAMANGVKLAAVYDTLTANGKQAAAAPAPQQPQQPAQAQADPNAVYKVPLGVSPAKGPATAKVTIVIFSDFQCPFCGRVEPTLKQLDQQYGDNLRFVWKNAPLPFHPNAMPAARAAMAAAEQGKFWEFHDKLFADQQHLDAQTYEKYAGELGLNMNKFKTALTDAKIQKSIEEDQATAQRFGSQGTPGFFINGRPLRGAQPLESFKAVIDKEITAANELLKKGVKAKDLYAELTKNGKDKADVAAPRPQPGAPDANTVYKALLEDAPVKGADAKHAKVTIVEFSDYQCPFCGRVEPTIDQVMKEYGKDVRLAFKELPLPMHNNAHAAAEAALAAKAQGKFWEMHDLMFKNQQQLDRASLEKYAAQIGLNVDKFKADLDSGKWKQKVDAELAEGNKIGARGTPSFFINGKSFVGAQPFEAFKAKIEEAIKDADGKVKGGNFAHYYDDLMKTAKAEVAAAPAQGAPPADDNKVYKVEAGNAPAVGPKGAPIQIVMFSDFQCPFCGRVEPTLKQLEDKYAGKIHLAWKNYPLPFHQFAQGAAEAAMAANAQGKFWPMHDKLFANQQALDRASLDKYAGEIGLDVNQFKSDLDSGKFKAAVNADLAYGNSLDPSGFGTPTFFINGHKISGAMPIDSFSAVVDKELAGKK